MERSFLKLGLFAKFFAAIVLLVLVFGIINISIVKKSVYSSLDSEIDNRSILISKAVAQQALPHILSENPVELNKLINSVTEIDRSIYYLFILNGNGEVIAHSFDDAVPLGLVDANPILQGNSVSTILIQESGDDDILIKDFAINVFNEKIGVVRLGVQETKIKSTISATVDNLLIMIVVFLIIGVLSALLFSFLIAKPITLLSKQSDFINIENIHESIEQIKSIKARLFFRIRRIFNTKDEIDLLYEKFLLMLRRLEENHNELSKIHLSIIQTEKMASIGTLSAGIAHEINNPISGLKNCLRRLNEAPDNFTQNVRYLSLMTEALDKMEKVVSQLLDFSKKDKIEFVPVDMKDCINSTLALIRYRIDAMGIKLHVNILNPNTILYGSKNQIEQVILNIILNSIESIEEKKQHHNKFEGEIVISADKVKETLILRISDNGIGINDDDIKSIFDPFFSVKKIRQGTGLGLAVSLNIINRHKGSISAYKNDDKGLTVEVIFPVSHGGLNNTDEKKSEIIL